jgi:hypothetical protein
LDNRPSTSRIGSTRPDFDLSCSAAPRQVSRAWQSCRARQNHPFFPPHRTTPCRAAPQAGMIHRPSQQSHGKLVLLVLVSAGNGSRRISICLWCVLFRGIGRRREEKPRGCGRYERDSGKFRAPQRQPRTTGGVLGDVAGRRPHAGTVERGAETCYPLARTSARHCAAPHSRTPLQGTPGYAEPARTPESRHHRPHHGGKPCAPPTGTGSPSSSRS